MNSVVQIVVIQCWLRQVSTLEMQSRNLSSILGVFSTDGGQPVTLDHSPRDFLPVENSYQEPAFTTAHVLEAVRTILKREQWTG